MENRWRRTTPISFVLEVLSLAPKGNCEDVMGFGNLKKMLIIFVQTTDAARESGFGALLSR